MNYRRLGESGVKLSEIGGEIWAQKDSFLCAAKGVSVGIAFNKKIGAGLFGGEGFIMERLQGDGWAFLNAGGLGILIGDGQLPHPGPEQILEAYYSYALAAAVKLTLDYQFVVNPGYNTDRGPANVFAARFRWTF